MTIEEIVTKTPKEFLSYLEPTDLKWKGWIFRGQPDSSYELKTSVWRDCHKSKLFEKFKQKINYVEKTKEIIQEHCSKFKNQIRPLKERKILNWFLWIKFENYLLSSFYQQANQSGLKITKQDIRRTGVYSPSYWLNEWAGNWLPGSLYSCIADFCTSHTFGLIDRPIAFDLALPQHHGLPTRVLD